MANILYSFQLPEELINQLREIAKENCLSVSAQLRTIILNYIKEYEES